MFQNPQDPPDELDPKDVSKENPRRRELFHHFFCREVQNLTVFSDYLHDSNSIFRSPVN